MGNVAPHIDGIGIIIIFVAIQGLLLISVFTALKRYKKHKIFISFILVLLYIQLHSFLIHSGYMINTLLLLNTDVPFVFLLGPLLFFYSKELLGYPFRWKKNMYHFIPFVFYFFYSFNFFLQSNSYKEYLVYKIIGSAVKEVPSLSFSVDPWNIQGLVVVELVAIHLFLYGIIGLNFILYQSHQSRVKKSTTNWIVFMHSMILLSGVILFLSEGGVVNGYVFFESPLPDFSGNLFALITMYATTIFLLLKPEFLSLKKKKYKRSSLSREIVSIKGRRLKEIIEKEKLYLQPNFSLDLLSEVSGYSRHHLSHIINEEFGSTFSKMTNEYRINEAKKVLGEKTFIKMESLAYELGYRSKSSFYVAFKRATTLTPTQFKNSVQG